MSLQTHPPSQFLDPERVARLTAEIKSRGRPSVNRQDRSTAEAQKPAKKTKKIRRRRRPASKQRVRTVVASMANSETFGWHVATEVKRRGLDRARHKACVCDGQSYNWSIFEMHLLAWGFIAILDFVHLLTYLYAAAHAWIKDRKRAWKQYEQWLRWAWAGKVKLLLASLGKAAKSVGELPTDAADNDPRRIVHDALRYVTNNRQRMDYPRYRRLGLPISSAPVESTIKQINRRIKGSEKFWLEGGAKGGRLRSVPLWWDGGTLADLTAWKAEPVRQGTTGADAFVWSVQAHRRGMPMQRHAIRRRFLSACWILGSLRNRTLAIHHGRHTFISHALAGGRSLAEVQAAVGHTNVAVTSAYLHIVVDDEEQVGQLFRMG